MSLSESGGGRGCDDWWRLKSVQAFFQAFYEFFCQLCCFCLSESVHSAECLVSSFPILPVTVDGGPILSSHLFSTKHPVNYNNRKNDVPASNWVAEASTIRLSVHQMRHEKHCISCQVFLNLEVQFADITWVFMNTLGCHEYLSLSWPKFQKKTPEQIEVEGSRGLDWSYQFFFLWSVDHLLSSHGSKQIQPTSTSSISFGRGVAQRIARTCQAMRMGQWAETEVIFTVYIYIYYMIYLEHFEAPSCSLAGCMIYLEHFEAPSCSLAGCMIYLEHFEAPSCSLAGCSGATTNTPQRRVENHSVKTPALVVKLTSPRPHFWTQVFGWAGVWHTTPMGTVPRHVASAEFSTEVPPVDLRFGMLIVQAFRCFHSGMEMRLSSPVYKRFKTHCMFFQN